MRDGWVETTLGDVSQIQMGQSPPGASYNERSLGLPFLQGSAEFGEHFPIPVKWCTEPKKIAKNGDLLLSVRAPVGDTNFANGDIAIGRGLASISGVDDLSVTEFIRLIIQVNVNELLASSGTGMFSSITGPNLRNLNVLMPPLVEQRRIVDVVESVDNYIAAQQERLDAARIARNAVLHELLNAGGDGWVETALGEVVSLSRTRVDPSALPPDSELVHWSIPMLDETGGPKIECASQIGSHKFVVHENAIVFSLLNPRIPRFAQIIGGANVVCSTEFAVLVPKESVLLDFLLTIVSSSGFQESISNLAKGTTKSRERINPQDLLKSSVMLPPLAEQRRIVVIVSSVDDSIQATEQTIVETKNLRSGLLSDLLSGEHEIPAVYDKLLGAA